MASDGSLLSLTARVAPALAACRKITLGLGGVVPLLQYIQGRRYEQLAELCGEVDESGTVPLRLLRNKEMMESLGSVVGVIKVFCEKANQGDLDAIEVSNKLDAAGREQVLFQALEAPDDDLKVLVMECLEEVPINNLQAPEVANIVAIVADCDNLTVGRTEEILGHTFSILSKLAIDENEEGIHFRRFHAATIHMALDILVRNTGRDTRMSNAESEEKAELSIGCIKFLRAASFDWAEAIELMQTRDAVDAMMAIMKNEEAYGREDLPIWIERTAVGSSTQALLQCLHTLDIKGEIAGRVLQRMAEVLEGRHTDEEIESADPMKIRDLSADTPEATKQRIAQHSLFVQVDGTAELMRYLLLKIPLSPTAYAPSGVATRILLWSKEQQDGCASPPSCLVCSPLSSLVRSPLAQPSRRHCLPPPLAATPRRHPSPPPRCHDRSHHARVLSRSLRSLLSPLAAWTSRWCRRRRRPKTYPTSASRATSSSSRRTCTRSRWTSPARTSTRPSSWARRMPPTRQTTSTRRPRRGRPSPPRSESSSRSSGDC